MRRGTFNQSTRGRWIIWWCWCTCMLWTRITDKGVFVFRDFVVGNLNLIEDVVKSVGVMRCHLRIQQYHLIFIIWKYDAQQNLTPQSHDPGFPLDLSDSYSVSIPIRSECQCHTKKSRNPRIKNDQFIYLFI